MWQLWLFLTALAALLVGLLLTAYERLRPSAALRRSGVVLLLSGTLAMLPVLIDRALAKPALWVAVALLVGILLAGPLMVRDASRPRP
ncbi:hypothetical protein AB0C04_03585 [Micromonospora sp. NPDC048909]|uniref:hypothetical protein n=1 Tax=Micromonospora sp. NPDC048909 TaxID=3155643 RepID=UPI0033DB00EB